MEKVFKSAWGEVIALIAGILFSLAFAPFDLPILIFIALALFRVLLVGLSNKRALLRGFFFGLGIFGLGVSWVFVSMVVNTETSYAIPLLMTLFYCSFWAIFPALFGYFFVKLTSSQAKTNPLFLFAGLWTLIEYIRGEWILSGFPWLQVAYSQLDSPFAGFIPVFGSYGTGFIVVILATLFAETCINKTKIMTLLVIFPLLILGGQTLKYIDWTHVSGDPLKVTLIQGNIAQKDKWALENRNTTLKQYYDDSANHWDSDVIIWPETAIPAYYAEVKEDYLVPLQQEAIQNNTDIITSLPYKDKEEKLYNAVLVLGKTPGMYKKIHLLPFGEYLPWQPISGYILGLMDIRLGKFNPGAMDQPLLKVAGYPIVTSICYEDAFGEQSIRNIEQARFLVNVTNDGWFDGSIEPYQHMQIARMRALEAGRYLLRATNTGVTAVVSEKGKIIKQAPLRKRHSLTSSIKPMSGLTPYSRIGDKTIILFIFLILIWQIVRINLRDCEKTAIS